MFVTQLLDSGQVTDSKTASLEPRRTSKFQEDDVEWRQWQPAVMSSRRSVVSTDELCRSLTGLGDPRAAETAGDDAGKDGNVADCTDDGVDVDLTPLCRNRVALLSTSAAMSLRRHHRHHHHAVAVYETTSSYFH